MACNAFVRKSRLGVRSANLPLVAVLLSAVAGCQPDRPAVSVVLRAPVVQVANSDDYVLAQKLNFLQAIRPGKLPSELASTPADLWILGRLAENDEVSGRVSETDEILAYENISKSLLSVSAKTQGAVRLTYTQAGLDEAESSQGGLATGGHIASAVAPIRLKNGWILAYDGDARSIIAFRKEAPREVDLGNGGAATVRYRTFDAQTTSSKNFGRGNGLVLSLVISGNSLSRQTNLKVVPIVTRFFELEENKVLLFLSGVDAIHLLELREETVEWPWDLEDPTNPRLRLPLKFLRGDVRLFTNPDNPAGAKVPFLRFVSVSSLTGNASVSLDSAPLFRIPGDGASLVFEQETANFLKLSSRVVGGEIVGSEVTFAIRSGTVLAAIQDASGSIPGAGLQFSALFLHPDGGGICMFEERSNSLLLYDYEARQISGNLKALVRTADFISPYVASGAQLPATGSEPVFVFATADVVWKGVAAARFAFEREEHRLLAIDYNKQAVVLSADSGTLASAQAAGIVDLTYLEPVGETELLAFDAGSSRLLRLPWDLATFVVTR
ncbi:MAG: hypothetical protein ACUVYA_12460 [Planctomycetota bacterium]